MDKQSRSGVKMLVIKRICDSKYWTGKKFHADIAAAAEYNENSLPLLVIDDGATAHLSNDCKRYLTVASGPYCYVVEV